MAHYDIFRGQLAIKYPAYGHALWEPRPGTGHERVEIGDVGFIREGQFHRLFNALLPEDHPSHRKFGVPPHHELLVPSVLDHINKSVLSRNHYCSAGITIDTEPDIRASKPEDFPEVSFCFTRRQGGAVLSIPVQAQRQNTLALGEFGRWMVKQIDRWFSFAQRLGLGIVQMEEIVFVTGFDCARSWTNVVFLEGEGDARVSFGVDLVGGYGPDASIKWHFSPERIRGALLNQGPEGKNLSENQCIFVRGFRVTRILRILPKQLKAAGGVPSDHDESDNGSGTDTALLSLSLASESKYRDPLHLLLDYVAETDQRALDCDMVLVHDDDLARSIEICDDTSLEGLQLDAVMAHFRGSNLGIHQARVTGGLSATQQSSEIGAEVVLVATPNSIIFRPWLPSATGASTDVSYPAHAPSTLVVPSPISKFSNYSLLHTVTTTTPTLNDTTCSPLFDHTPDGSPSSCQQSFYSRQHLGSLNRSLPESNKRSMAAQDPLHDPLSNATKGRHRRRRRRHSRSSVLPSPSSASDSADRRPGTAGSTASSGWGSQVESLAESLQGKTTVTSTQDILPIMSADQNTSPFDRYVPVFANPFSEHNYVDTRPGSPVIFDTDPVLHPETAHTRLDSPASPLVSVSRSVASEDGHDIVPPDQSVNKSYVSLPGNAVAKRPRRRYDEIERIYQCSWSGCTKRYGTLNHLNAHIVMRRHGNERTPDEFKELREQSSKAKKDESERLARLERSDALRSEPALQYPPQPYERQPESVPYGQRHHLYDPGIPAPEMDYQLAGGETTARYPLSAEGSLMRHQPLQQQPYSHAMSGSGHSLSSVAPHTPMPSPWPEQATQYEVATLPQPGSTSRHARNLLAQDMYDYGREPQGHSWTPPSIPHPPPSVRLVPSYVLSPSYTHSQPPPQRMNTLPPDSTLLAPLPGYQPSIVEPEYEEEYDNKQQFWTEGQ